jgi:hypothetical protein
METERIARKRNRGVQTQTLGQRFLHSTLEARIRAKQLAPRREREMLLRKARQADAAADLDEWLSSPRLPRR